MKVWEIQDSFGLDQLALTDRPEPAPGPGQVALRMKAASLNYRDLLMVRGHYNPRQPLPLIPCSDGVGVVDAVGDGVERVAVGDRVIPIFAQRWISGRPTHRKLKTTLGGPLDGTLAGRMVVDAQAVVHAPEHLTDVEAAALPCAGLTAWSALVEQGGLRPGDVVLVQGTGGVSMFALLIARMIGARVIVTSSSGAKLERVRELGADHTLNYVETPKWGKPARELAGGDGVDHVVEVGGAGTLAQSLRAVRPGGHISMIGVLAGASQELDVIPILMQNVRVQGVLVGHREGFERMNRAITQAQLRPIVSDVFGFDELPAAFEHMAQGNHFGKICLEFE